MRFCKRMVPVSLSVQRAQAGNGGEWWLVVCLLHHCCQRVVAADGAYDACHLQIEKVMLPYSKEDPSKYRDYGFVHFKDRASALQAIARAEDDKPKIDDKEVTVSVVVGRNSF